MKIVIDGREVAVDSGVSVLEAADSAGIYIPRLCFHPSLTDISGLRSSGAVYRDQAQVSDNGKGCAPERCNLCIVEIKGRNGFFTACSTQAQESMSVVTGSKELQQARRKNLTRIIAGHPHACLTCDYRDGCNRDMCTEGVPEEERCCCKFDNCELQRLVEYIGLEEDIQRFVYGKYVPEKENVLTRNYNLCVDCARCVRACREIAGAAALDYVHSGGKFTLGTAKATLKESKCKFCGACVEVCPTGALMYADSRKPRPVSQKIKKVVLPPENILKFNPDSVGAAPESNGVYELMDDSMEVIYIKGAVNIREDLLDKLQTVKDARYFRYEENCMYTMRESELLQKYIIEKSKMPRCNEDII